MGIACLQHVAAIIFQQNIFAVVDVARGLPVGHLFDPSPQAIVAVRGRRDSRGIAGRELLHLRQAILRIVAVLRIVARGEQRFSDEVPVVVVLVAMVSIRRELIPWVHDNTTGGAIPHRVIGKRLRIE